MGNRWVRRFLILFLFFPAFLWGQQNPKKYALVIGNGAYTSSRPLNNPANDANDMALVLSNLGFTVDKVINGSLREMENAILRLRDRLSVSSNTYGFFYYAGHGVQSNGLNYLIPVNANIPDEGFLRERAVSVQAMLDILNEAENALNVVVLDACRDNPFSWTGRGGGSRGLAPVNAPVGSIVMYATSSNSVADDGTGRNGLFTGQLLNNLKISGLTVQQVFNRTGQDVIRASNGKQHPEISIKYFENAYLGSSPVAPPPQDPITQVGIININSAVEGAVLIDGQERAQIRANGIVQLTGVPAGNVDVAVRGTNGITYRPLISVIVRQNQVVTATISYKLGDYGPARGFVFYDKGNYSNGWRYMEAAPADVGYNVSWGIWATGHTYRETRTETGVGTGRQNTQYLLEGHLQLNETGKAAQVAANYRANGFSDWFLPSKEELKLMYQNLKARGIGGFSNTHYWSSSDVGDGIAAWAISFSNGSEMRGDKKNTSTGPVRAIRYF